MKRRKSRRLFFPPLILVCQLSMGQIHNSLTPDPGRDSLLSIINKPQDDSAKVNACHILSALTAGTDPAAAIVYAKKGAAIGKKIGFSKGAASCYLSISYCYGVSGNLVSALLYIDSAIVWYKKVGKPDRLGLCYYNRADYKIQLGKLRQALNDCDTAFMYAEQANKINLKGKVYRSVGSVYYLQNEYDQSKAYYEKAYDFFAATGDTMSMISILNKTGSIYEYKKEYDKSIRSFEKALEMSGKISEENDFAAYYTNLSAVWLKKGDKKKAEINALKAVEYARQKNNKLQLTAAQTVLSKIYLQTDSTELAIQAAAESFAIADSTEAKEAKKNSAYALSEAFLKSGDFKKAYHYLQIGKTLGDSLAKEKYDDKIAGMQIAFKVNEKDKEILLLAKDKKLQEQKLKEQRYLITGAAVIALLALIGIWLAVNRNRLRQKMEELELRNRIAADLHDEVGSSLSSIHMLSQMATQQDNATTQKDILSKMSTNAKETMDKMSDIVWMIKPVETEAASLKQRMERFAYEICSSRNIDVSMQLEALEKAKLSIEQRKNVYLVFKEALNNAVKYSGTEKVTVKASIQNKQLALLINDLGKGFDTGMTAGGNGLDNMKNRAQELNGQLRINSEKDKGTSVELIIPV